MLRYLLLLLFAIPFIEIYLLLQIAGIIGFWQTLGVILLTGLVGAEIIRREGRHILLKLQISVTGGEISRNILEAALLALSGLFLLSPGILTDGLGFLLVIRPIRERLVVRIANKYAPKIQVETRTFTF